MDNLKDNNMLALLSAALQRNDHFEIDEIIRLICYDMNSTSLYNLLLKIHDNGLMNDFIKYVVINRLNMLY